MASLEDVGAVIVTHDRADAALGCVTAVLGDLQLSQIVVVVNDPGGTSAPDLARLQESGIRLVLNESRSGYGANINRGVSQLPPDLRYLLFLNDDAIVQQGAIAALESMIESLPAVGLVGSQLVDERGVAQPSWHAFPTVASEILDALMLPAAIERRIRSRYTATNGDDGLGWPVGAALLARATAFNEVEGFDEAYFLYSEELDLAFRLRQRGWESSFCADALVQHVGAQSTRGRYERMLGLSRWRYICTHWSRTTRFVLIVLLAVAYAWNALYVAGRIAADPRSYREKILWWQSRWARRPLPALPAQRD